MPKITRAGYPKGELLEEGRLRGFPFAVLAVGPAEASTEEQWLQPADPRIIPDGETDGWTDRQTDITTGLSIASFAYICEQRHSDADASEGATVAAAAMQCYNYIN